MQNERTISTITFTVAKAIVSTGSFWLDKFCKEANENEYFSFTHKNFFYSYPEFGKEWPEGKSCEFHRVHTKCHLCDFMPDRNFAGYGTIYLLNNGICNDSKLVSKYGVKMRVPNSARLSRMILLCPKHVASYFEWDPIKKPAKKETLQLSLFHMVNDDDLPF